MFSHFRDAPQDLSAQDFTVVKSRQLGNRDDQPVWGYAKRQCMHCQDPACASACPVRALRKTPDGPVIYREDLCMGCRYCMVACPFDVPRFDYDKVVPSICKCNFCADKLDDKPGNDPRQNAWKDEGQTFAPAKLAAPNCTSKCPVGALRFGDREELLNFAKAKIGSHGAAKYVQHIYGEREAGGTSWLYISSVPFEQLGFNIDIPHTPYSEFTKPFLTGVPLVIILGSGLLSGLYWIIKRREELAKSISDETATAEAVVPVEKGGPPC